MLRPDRAGSHRPLEIALVIPLAIAFRINQKHARVVSGGEALGVVLRRRRTIRKLAFALTAVITAMNFGALFELVRALMAGTTENGRTLLLDAVNIWVTNIIVFALWFWGVDGGGPAAREAAGKTAFEFLFPQATVANQTARRSRPASSTICSCPSPTRPRSRRPIRCRCRIAPSC